MEKPIAVIRFDWAKISFRKSMPQLVFANGKIPIDIKRGAQAHSNQSPGQRCFAYGICDLAIPDN